MKAHTRAAFSNTKKEAAAAATVGKKIVNTENLVFVYIGHIHVCNISGISVLLLFLSVFSSFFSDSFEHCTIAQLSDE